MIYTIRTSDHPDASALADSPPYSEEFSESWRTRFDGRATKDFAEMRAYAYIRDGARAVQIFRGGRTLGRLWKTIT